MELTRSLLASKLQRWEKYMLNYELPTWGELPDLELYMDQVVALVTRYLDILPQANMTDAVITPSTINNYVRMKVMPAPVRKKYTKVHLAYLLLICLLKQSLTLAEIQIILPVDLSEAEARTIYDSFVLQLHDSSRRFITQVKEEAKGIFDTTQEDGNVESVEDLTLSMAVSSVLNRLLATKLLNLRSKTQEKQEEAIPDEAGK